LACLFTQIGVRPQGSRARELRIDRRNSTVIRLKGLKVYGRAENHAAAGGPDWEPTLTDSSRSNFSKTLIKSAKVGFPLGDKLL
jgi:hypothetical protein